MTRITTSAALAVLAISAAPAAAQQPVAPAQPYTYARPGVTYYTPPRDNRAVLPSFSQRGGIGTTPFLGNTRGLGGYSTNYDAAPRPKAAPPARRGWFFRRNR